MHSKAYILQNVCIIDSMKLYNQGFPFLYNTFHQAPPPQILPGGAQNFVRGGKALATPLQPWLRLWCSCTKNIGYLYVSRTLQALGIDPGENCIAHGIVMEEKLASDMIRKLKKRIQGKRHQLQTQRLSKNTKREAKEGQTYQTGIGLDLDTPGKKESKKQTKGVLTVLGVDPSKITMEERLEFEKLVPRFTQRPTKLNQRFDSSVAYNFIFLDLETTATGKTAEICQLSAKSLNGNALSKYEI
jgi:hypothetical protein